MQKKGISPIVGVVLLIAITISIGVLATGWVRNWIMGQTSSDLLTCILDTNYQIDSAVYNSTSKVLRLKITNKDARELYGFGIVLDNGTTTKTFNSSASEISLSPSISSSNKLKREESVYMSVNLTSYSALGSSLIEVKVTNDVCNAVSAKTDSITVQT
jgi:flagellin-like protein